MGFTYLMKALSEDETCAFPGKTTLSQQVLSRCATSLQGIQNVK